MQKVRNYRVFLCSVFILTISIPLIFSNKIGGSISNEENRYLAKFPTVFDENGKLVSHGLRQGLEDWINDNAFGREIASKINKRVNLEVFHQNPTKEIMYGKEKWIFLTHEDNIKGIQHADVPNEARLQEIKTKLRDMGRYFDNKEIKYQLNIFPNKVDVYPEYLLDTIRPIQDKSLLDVFYELKKEENDNINIDIDEFMKEKKDRVIYSKASDTSHWNKYGAFIGYSQIMKGLQEQTPNIKVLDKDDYIISPIEKDVYIANKLYTTETDYQFEYQGQRTASEDSSFFEQIGYTSQDPWCSYRHFVNSDKELPKAVIIGDSYVWMFMLEDIAESFSEVVFIHQLDINNLDKVIDFVEPDNIIIAGLDRTVLACIDQYSIPKVNSPETNMTTDQPFQNLDYVNNEVFGSQDIYIDSTHRGTTLEGWAVDVLADNVASAVLVQVGDKIYQADYGKERQSVVDFFNKPNWINSGYVIKVPTQALLEEGSMKILVVSNDGKYKYESQQYIINQK